MDLPPTRPARRSPALPLLTLAALLAASPALAATWQVGPTRTYKTLGAVAGLLAPGDIVELDGNATYGGNVTFSRPGSAAQPITVRGVRVNGKRPVISGGSNGIEAAASHYVFEALDITASTTRCFFHHADDITVRDSVIHDCPAHGLLGADADAGSLLLEYSEFHHSGATDQRHQIYMATDETAYPRSVFRMQHCYVHDGNGGHNVKSRAERNEIYGNWIEGAFYQEVELIGPDGQDEGLAREDSDVVGNVFRKTRASAVARFGGDGTGQTHGRYRFAFNTVLVQPNTSTVIRLFDGVESIEASNNVFAAIGGGVVRNVVEDVYASWSSGGRLVAGSNNWVATGSSLVPSEWSGTRTGTDPRFVNAATLDLVPGTGSPLLDAALASAAGVPNHPFPSPLVVPAFLPPNHEAELPGNARTRGLVGVADIGAFEAGSSGPVVVVDAGAPVVDAGVDAGARDAGAGPIDSGVRDAGANVPFDAGAFGDSGISSRPDASAAGDAGAAGAPRSDAGPVVNDDDGGGGGGCSIGTKGRGPNLGALVALCLVVLRTRRRR